MMILTDTSNTATAAASTDDSTNNAHVPAAVHHVHADVHHDVTSPTNNNAVNQHGRAMYSAPQALTTSDNDVTDEIMPRWTCGPSDKDEADAGSTDEDNDGGEKGRVMCQQDAVDFICRTSSTSSASSSCLSRPASIAHHSDQAYHASLDRPMFSKTNLSQHWGAKGDMVYSLLSILGTHNRDDMSRTLLAMSTSSDSCLAMKQSGCLPLLVHLIHDMGETVGCISENQRATRARASAALHNIVTAAAAAVVVGRDDVSARHEVRVLRLLEQLRAYCDHLRPADTDIPLFVPGPVELHPGPAIAALMKLSFDEQHRQAICALGLTSLQ